MGVKIITSPKQENLVNSKYEKRCLKSTGKNVQQKADCVNGNKEIKESEAMKEH